MTELDAVEIWKISGITAILSSAFTIWVNYWLASKKEKRVRNEELRYQALRAALSLEKFSIACADIVGDAADYDASNGAVGKKHTALPAALVHEAIQWKLFELDVANEILSFENTIAYGNYSIGFHLSVANHHEDTDEAELQAGLCGYIAHEIAARLRSQYDLGDRWRPFHGYDYVPRLKKMHDIKQKAYRESHTDVA